MRKSLKAALHGEIVFPERYFTFTVSDIDGINLHEQMKFGAQISKTRLKMKDAEEVFVCIILSEHTKT